MYCAATHFVNNLYPIREVFEIVSGFCHKIQEKGSASQRCPYCLISSAFKDITQRIIIAWKGKIFSDQRMNL